MATDHVSNSSAAAEQPITDAKDVDKDEPIVINVNSASISEWPTSWIPDLNITVADRDILSSSCAWLTDSLINAAQILMKKENPLVSGLQNVNFGLTNNFDVQTGEFVQILHTGKATGTSYLQLEINIQKLMYSTVCTVIVLTRAR